MNLSESRCLAITESDLANILSFGNCYDAIGYCLPVVSLSNDCHNICWNWNTNPRLLLSSAHVLRDCDFASGPLRMSESFWLDTSDDSIFFAPSSNIPSRSSADSLDINDIPLDNYPSLLLPSRSLNALPLCDYELVKPPPCPSTSPRRNRRRTQYTFLSLVASLALPKGTRPRRKYANVLVSSPTPGRLRNVPQLKPVLKTWIVSFRLLCDVSR